MKRVGTYLLWLFSLIGFLSTTWIQTMANTELDRPLDRLAAQLKPNEKRVYKTIGDRELSLHIFYPEDHAPSDTRAAFVAIHGGGWVNRDASYFYPFADYFAKRGLVSISIDYRLHRREPGVSVFDCVKDARSAMRYLRQHAADLGIDPDKIIVSGGSAGAHLAAGTVLFDEVNDPTDNLDVSTEPALLILYYPVIDTSSDGYGQEKIGDRWKELSPVDQVKPNMPPTLVLHGTGDTVTPFSGVERFHEAMQAAGNDCRLITYEGGRHGYFLFDLELFSDAMKQTEAFLKANGLLAK